MKEHARTHAYYQFRVASSVCSGTVRARYGVAALGDIAHAPCVRAYCGMRAHLPGGPVAVADIVEAARKETAAGRVVGEGLGGKAVLEDVPAPRGAH